MNAFEGTPDEYREHPEGSRQFWRFVDGEPVGAPTWVREGVTFAEVYERRANPPPPEPDPRDAKIAALEARIGKVEAETIAARKLQKD